MARNTESTETVETTNVTEGKKATRVLAPRPVYTILEGDPDAIQTVFNLQRAGSIKVKETTRDNEAIVDAVSNGDVIVFFKGLMK